MNKMNKNEKMSIYLQLNHSLINSLKEGNMKQKILEALKTKFEGVQDAILNRIAEKLAKTVTTEEGIATAVEGVTLQQVIDTYADSRATEASATAVSNYEKKHKLKDGKPEEKEPDPKPAKKEGDEDVPAWAKTLIDSNKSLTEKLERLESEKSLSKRSEQLADIVKDAPEAIKQRFTKDFNRMKFDTEEDYTQWIEEVKADVTTLVTDLTASGVVFKKPAGGGGGTPPEKPSDIVLERIKERETTEGATSVIAGLPTKK